MADVRYVCFSDMHFGAGNSMLTHLKAGSIDPDPSQPSRVLTQLVACLTELLARNQQRTKPTLILNGDILELALATDNVAAMAFERFIELIMPANAEPLFDPKIIYLPGNHDHHLWETARETQYLKFITDKGWGKELAVPWHVTEMFEPSNVPAYFLNGLLQCYPHANGAQITTVYPNFGVARTDGRRCVIFSHGHFTESMYMLMTTLRTMLLPDRKQPQHVWDLEAENFAWIDFFWSTMGRSGDVGTDITLLYAKLQDDAQVENLIGNLATSLAQRFGSGHLANEIEAVLLRKVLDATLGGVAKLERSQPGGVMSPDCAAGLKAYLEGPLRDQIIVERTGNVPPEVTFVFGHTHKPFEQDMQFTGYPGWVGICNSGGWVVDSVTRQPLQGGAAILVDEDLNVASLRFYNQAADPAAYVVSVEAPSHPGAEPNPFCEHIRSLIDPAEDPWKTFSKTVADVVPTYAQNLQLEINRP